MTGIPHQHPGKHNRDRIEDHFYGTVTVGERGQIVIPAEARREYEIETGDKLLIMSHPKFRSIMVCKIDSMREFLTEMIEDLRKVESQISGSELPPTMDASPTEEFPD